MRSLVCALIALLAPAVAGAQAATYLGPHPVDLDGHWHDGEVLHDHGELVVGEGPFGEVAGVRVFLGDPIAYAWTGAVWTYRGAHPLPSGLEGYCGVPGDHRHAFAPEGSFRRASDGAHVYRGAMRGGLPMARPARTAPERAIVTAPPTVATAIPYWLWGCRFQLLPGSRGSLVPTPFDPSCSPGAGIGPSWGTSRSPAATAEPPLGDWFDGNYGGIQTRPVQGGRPPRDPVQRE